jgi:hypothetical protein
MRLRAAPSKRFRLPLSSSVDTHCGVGVYRRTIIDDHLYSLWACNRHRTYSCVWKVSPA